jgi:hypothetical protein
MDYGAATTVYVDAFFHNFQDDHDMLVHGLVIYDALYVWCRYVQTERHTWNPGAYV